MESTGPQFVLSAELVGHERDVRGVCMLKKTPGALVTASRDNTLKLWVLENGAWACRVTFVGHTHFVGPVIELPDGNIASGGYDHTVLIWSLGSPDPVMTLVGHEQAVVALSVTANGDIISGSWDKTVRVWRNGETAQILRGHEEGVWGVVGAPNGDIWSGSADKSIRIWRDGNCVRTIREAADCVRALRAVPGTGVICASNDGIVRLYSWEGDALRQLHGHSSFVYAACVLNASSGEMVSAGEDCTVRIWSGDNECSQTLQLPSTVWDVDVGPNGDVAVACADFIARIFTRDPSRQASIEAVGVFEERLKKAAAAAKGAGGQKVGDLDLSNLQGSEALLEPGTTEGQTKVVLKASGDGAEVYSWTGGQWTKLGDVMNAVDKRPAAKRSNKDYNFDVDFNGQKLVISMNKGDNIYETACQFIAENGLSEEMVDQVVEHLHKVVPSGGGGGGGGGGIHNPDPFTGDGGNPEAARSGAGGQHRPKWAEELSYNPSPWGADPPAAEVVKKAKPAAPKRCFPRAVMVLFDVPGNTAGLCKKAAEWGADAGALAGILARFQKGVIVDADLAVVQTILSWEASRRFPALDLLRLLALNESASTLLASKPLWSQALEVGFAPGAPSPCLMLALRLACNAFRWPPLKDRLLAELPHLLDLAADAAQSKDAKVINALVSVLNNVAVHIHGVGGHSDVRTQVIGVLGEVLGHGVELAPADAQLAVAALGTIVVGDEEARSLIADLDVAPKLEALQKHTDAAVKRAAGEVLAYATKMDESK